MGGYLFDRREGGLHFGDFAKSGSVKGKRDQGVRSGLTTEQFEELKELRRENEIFGEGVWRISPRPSARSPTEGMTAFCGPAPRQLWGRADLCGVADRPFHVSASTNAAGGNLVGVRLVPAATPN